MGQRPISHSFTYKNHDFDWPFCIFMGPLEKMMGPRILNRHLTIKLTSNVNSLCMGPNQKLKQIKSISTNFLTKQLGPIPEISLLTHKNTCENTVLEMAGRQVAKCDQKSFWATTFGQKYVNLSPKELCLGDQLRICACILIIELCQCKFIL